MQPRYSVILGFLGQITDRFSSYHAPKTTAEKIATVTRVEGATGIEAVYPFDYEGYTFQQYRDLLTAHNMVISSVNVNLKAEPKFHHGALTSIDADVRTEAVRYIKQGMDWAAELGTNLVTVCPLSDGHDYHFEIDYRQTWKWMIEGLGEAASYRPEVRLSVEYKQSEPRARVIVPNAGITLLLCEQIGMPNVGITVDTGHALYAAETTAQALSLAAYANRLFLVHINDNYRNWDWDLIPGTVNWWDWLETLLVLDEIDYDGWLVSDVFPSRTDPVETLSASYRAIVAGLRMLEQFGKERLRGLIKERKVLEVYDTFHRAMLGEGVSSEGQALNKQ